MRTSIIAVQDFSDIPTVLYNTEVACHVTHADPRCLASCVAVTTAIALMLQGKHRKKDGSYDVDSLSKEAYVYASKCLNEEEQVSSFHTQPVNVLYPTSGRFITNQWTFVSNQRRVRSLPANVSYPVDLKTKAVLLKSDKRNVIFVVM